MDSTAGYFDNSRLHLVILPTEQCNYRCTYCYESFPDSRMRAPVVEGILRFLSDRFERVPPQGLTIAWFGGEPLLADGPIETIMRGAKLLSDRYGVELTGTMSTNGHLLSPARFEALVADGVDHFQITLDGARPFHDARRRTRNGPGAYEQIVSNLRAACATDHDFSVTLRVHVDRNNAATIPLLLADIADLTHDRRVTISFERLKNLGHQPDDEIDLIDASDFAAFVRGIVAMPDFAGVRFADVLADLGTVPCYASLPNSFVFRADGAVQKCTVALGAASNTVGRLDPVEGLVLNENYLDWISVWGRADPKAIACPARALLGALDSPEPAKSSAARPATAPV